MSKILDLIYDEESVVVFDIDGVLAKFEYGERNHVPHEEYNTELDVELAAVYTYGGAKPVESLQKLISNKKHVFVCGVYSPGEQDAKTSFIRRYYNIPQDHIYLVREEEYKLAVINKIAEKYPDVPVEKVIIVDDSVSILTYIQDKSDYSTCHISSFLE